MVFHTKTPVHPRAAAAVALAALCLAAFPAAGAAQQAPDTVAARLDRLQARVDSLQSLVQQLQEGGAAPAAPEAADPLAALRAAAQAAAAKAGGAPPDTTPGGEGETPVFAGRQRSLQALNPEISVTGDLLAHVDKDHTDQQNFLPREFELAIQSTLDPYSRAKVIMSLHEPGPEITPFQVGDGAVEGSPEFAVEEGYAEWVGLPGGIGLKVGRFYQRFGTLNRWHSHAFYFQSRQLPHIAFIGQEPLSATGVSATWLVPVHGVGTWELTGELTRSNNDQLWGVSHRPSVLGHLNAFWQLSDATDLDLGVSWVNGSYQDDQYYFDRNFQGAEAAFTWRPPAHSKTQGVVVRAGAMRLDGLVPPDGATFAPGEGSAWGAWSMTEARLTERTLVGARVDWTENPLNTDQTAWMVSPTLTWWQSEFVRLRLEYDLVGRNYISDRLGKLWLQATFAMGPHKHETY